MLHQERLSKAALDLKRVIDPVVSVVNTQRKSTQSLTVQIPSSGHGAKVYKRDIPKQLVG